MTMNKSEKPQTRMKRIYVIILVAAGMVPWLTVASGQASLKIGHLNINEVIASLPERDSAAVILDRETKEYQAVYEEMQAVYNKFLDDFQRDLPTYSELMRKTKEAEVIDKQKRISEFEQTASATLQQRNEQLIQPIYEKVMKAIETVANENEFTYILDIGRGGILFTAKDSNDVTELVRAKLK
jgi:outer membrane protein